MICFILSILFVLSLKEACFISQVTKWSISNHKELDKEASGKAGVLPRPPPRVFPRSYSDNPSRASVPGRDSMHTKIVRVSLFRSNVQAAKPNVPGNVQAGPGGLGLQKEPTVRPQMRDYQQNLIRFSSGSEAETPVKVATQPRDYQRGVMLFSEDGSPQSRKFELLKLSSVGSSCKSSQAALKEQFARRLPADFVNVSSGLEKLVDVVMNQRKEARAGVLLGLLPEKAGENGRKPKYQGVKKSFYLFKKQTVFEEKPEDPKSKNPSGRSEAKK